jgi:hypothetical protein
MQAHLQGIERETAIDRYDEFAIEHKVLARKRAKIVQHLGAEPRQGLARLGLDFHVPCSPECEAAETIPFRLELPPGLLGQLRNKKCLHRCKRERNAKAAQLQVAFFDCRHHRSCGVNLVQGTLDVAIVLPRLAASLFLAMTRTHRSERGPLTSNGRKGLGVPC